MRELTDQTELEYLLGKVESPLPPPRLTIIYFTASWCSACKSLDIEALEMMSPHILWLKCDVDTNTYTPGYCNVRAIPHFMAIMDKNVAGSLQQNKTQNVIEWAQKLVNQL